MLALIGILAQIIFIEFLAKEVRNKQNLAKKAASKQTLLDSSYGIIVKPAAKNPVKWATARCNDGTPFAFQFRRSQTNSQEWVIHLQGGGFCDDDAEICSKRIKNLTTTLPGNDGQPTTMQKQGIFSQDPGKNPYFFDANQIYAHYCSSDVWSGSTALRRQTTGDAQNGWFFSGRLNVKAMVEVLKEEFGLDDNNSETQVLFSGGSAGGGGAEVNADILKSQLPNAAKAGRLKILNDAGVFVDFDNPNYRTGESDLSDKDIFKSAYKFWGSKLNRFCENAMLSQGEDKSLCFFTYIDYQYVTASNGLNLPFLVQASSIDSAVMFLHGINYRDPNDSQAVSEWRSSALRAMENYSRVFSNGEYPYHVLLTNDGSQNGWDMGRPGSSYREVAERFWNDGPAERVIFGNPETDITPVPTSLPTPTPIPTICTAKSPSQPKLLSPASGLQVSQTKVTLSWKGVKDWGKSCKGGSKIYNVYVDTVNPPQSIVKSLSSSKTSLAYTGRNDQKYFWMIEASNGDKKSKSDVSSFRILLPAATTTPVPGACELAQCHPDRKQACLDRHPGKNPFCSYQGSCPAGKIQDPEWCGCTNCGGGTDQGACCFDQ